MTDEKLVYREGVMSTVDAVRTRLTPKIRNRFKTEAGFDEDVKRPTYPLETLDGIVRIIAEELYPGLPKDEAQYQFGMHAMRRYGESALGKALFPLIRLLGPMKFMKRMPQLFRQTNNYADVKVQVTGPTTYEFDHNEVGAIPHYIRGVMAASGELVGLKSFHCELLEYDGHRARYSVDWRS